MKKNTLSAYVLGLGLGLVFLFGCSPVNVDQGTKSAKPDATVVIKDAGVITPDTAPANTGTVATTGTVTATATSTLKLDAGTMIADTAPANTGTNIVTNTVTNTVKNATTNTAITTSTAKLDAGTVLQPDSATPVADAAVDAPVPVVDTTKPVVQIPYIGAGDKNNLPVGVSISFYASASDDTGIAGCMFYLNGHSVEEYAALVGDKWHQDIVLVSGKNTIVVQCADKVNNIGVSPTLEVWAGNNDSGAASNADTQPVATPDAQASDTVSNPECVGTEIDPNRICSLTLPNGVVRPGNTSCEDGKWKGCKDMNPPENAMSCIGYLKNQVSSANCKVFDGCYDGLYVCNGSTWTWECQLDTNSWYVSPGCIKNDAGTAADTYVAPTPDTRPADTTPIIVTDAGTADTQVPTPTTCQVTVNGQVTTLTNGQTIDCTLNGAQGQQQCVSGMLSTCVVGGSATTMGDHAIVDCQLTGTNVGTLTLTGNVIGDLYDSGTINRVCVVGDSVGGWTSNHTLCLDYSPLTSFRYNFANIPLPNTDNRITFLGYLKTVTDGGVVEGPERWDNNFVLLYAATAGNKCRMKDQAANKAVFSQ